MNYVQQIALPNGPTERPGAHKMHSPDYVSHFLVNTSATLRGMIDWKFITVHSQRFQVPNHSLLSVFNRLFVGTAGQDEAAYLARNDVRGTSAMKTRYLVATTAG